MTPIEASKPHNTPEVLRFQQELRYKIMGRQTAAASGAEQFARPAARYPIGSPVRILFSPITKGPFYKAHQPGSGLETVYVAQVIPGSVAGYRYKLRDRNGRNIRGTFIEQQLVHSEET